ncbi:MAG: MFS transporter [Verrucomicrobia bacterium]|nr:MFS transporter [Verrucomicrobiota bacterium]
MQPQAAPPSPQTPYSAPRKQMWIWGLGGVSEATMAQIFGILFNIFQTWFGVDPKLLGSVFALPRLIDAFLDPALGHFSDNLHTRWGRRKPILLATSLIGALVMAGIWWLDPSWPQWVQAIYLFVFATTYYCALGTFGMSHQALGYELTDDYHERSRFIAIKAVFTTLVTMMVSWSYKTADLPFFGDRITGIRWVGFFFACLVVCFTIPVLRHSKERFARSSGEHAGLLTSLRQAMGLQPFRVYIAMRFFSAFGLVIFNQLNFFINLYFVCSGNQSQAYEIMGWSLTLTALLSLALMPLVPKISKKIGKRTGFIISSGLALFQAVLVPLLYTPSNPYLQLVAAAVTAPLIAIGVVLRDAIVPDICDLDELTHGKRREGLLSAAIAFVYKLEVSLCVFIVGLLLAWVGLDQSLSTQSPDAITRLQWATFAPNILCSALAFFFATRFSITEDQARQTIQTLIQRRSQAP